MSCRAKWDRVHSGQKCESDLAIVQNKLIWKPCYTICHCLLPLLCLSEIDRSFTIAVHGLSCTLQSLCAYNYLFAQDLNFIRSSPHRYPFISLLVLAYDKLKAKLVMIYYYSYSGSYVEGLFISGFFFSSEWCDTCAIWCILYLPQDHVQQTTPVVVDLVEVVTVICYVTFIETAVLILPRPASHVSSQSLWLRTVRP